MFELPPAIEARLQGLPQGLRDHIERARHLARELAQRHGVDVARADLAAAAHDLARARGNDRLLEQAAYYNLQLNPVEAQVPVLLHGPVAACWLEQEAGVVDKEVLEAVWWHSTGRRSMGPLARVIFLADKLDPHKTGQFPDLRRIRTLAEESLDEALLGFLDLELGYLVRQGALIHPASIELRNELITRS